MQSIARNFPDVAQAAIASGTILNQSRITFQSGHGQLLVIWNLTVSLNGAIAMSNARLLPSGSARPAHNQWVERWTTGVGGNKLQLMLMSLYNDPPRNSFTEVLVVMDAGSFNVNALDGALQAFSFPHNPREGPTMTILT